MSIDEIKALLATRNPKDRHKYSTPEGITEQVQEQSNDPALKISFVLYGEGREESLKKFFSFYFDPALNEIRRSDYERLKGRKAKESFKHAS